MRGVILAVLAVAAGCSETGIRPQAPEVQQPDPDTGDQPVQRMCATRVFREDFAPRDDECRNDIVRGTFTPIVEWSLDRFDVRPDARNVMMQPIVASVSDDDGDGDIDADDLPDILFLRYPGQIWTGPGVLTAVSGDGSAVLWNQADLDLQGSGALAAGDIDGDGMVEILTVTTKHELVALEHDGTLKWKTDYVGFACATTAPAISDMDGDGRPEIVVGLSIYDNTGALLGRGDAGHGACLSFPADLDGDGVQEVVTGNAAYRIDGSSIWSNGLADGYPAVADFDGDGDPEIVVVDQVGAVRLQDHEGAVLWSRTAGRGVPTVADFDGDGLPEIGVADGGTYTMLDGDGIARWRRSTVDGSSGFTGSSVFDFEGDGVAEVVYADEQQTWVFSGVDGSVRLRDNSHSSWTWTEYPVVVDVDADGQAEIVVPNGQIGDDVASASYGITVIGDADGSWRPARKIWNQHAYHITNVEDDGSIPQVAQPSWLGPNSFRSGDISGKVGRSATDLLVDVATICEVECDRGRLVVWVQARNEGTVDAANASLRVSTRIGGQVELLDIDEIELGPLEAGRVAAGIRIDIEDVDPTVLDALIFEVLTDDFECRTDNNQAVLEGPFCAGG